LASTARQGRPGGLPEVAAAKPSVSGQPACGVGFGKIRAQVRLPGPHPLAHLFLFFGASLVAAGLNPVNISADLVRTRRCRNSNPGT
jgi:hypothetical protein